MHGHGQHHWHGTSDDTESAPELHVPLKEAPGSHERYGVLEAPAEKVSTRTKLFVEGI